MSVTEHLRMVVGRLQKLLTAALTDASDTTALENARYLAGLALEVAGGTSHAAPAPASTFDMDTVTENQSDLAFVLGSLERVARQPDRRTHLLLDASLRLQEVDQRLARPRSH